jgi:hypothetical protein
VVRVMARARFFAGDDAAVSDVEGLEPLLGGRRSSFASWSFQAIAFSRRIRLASLTRRRNRGSVVRVRKVSFRILAYAGEAPRWMSPR